MTSTATATPPTSGACSTTRPPTTSGSTPTRTATSPTTPMMRPYKEKYDIGHFGTDNPATAVARADAVRRRVPQGRRHSRRSAGRGTATTSSTSASSRARTAPHVAGITAAQRPVRHADRRRRARRQDRLRRAPAPGAAAAPAAALTDGMIDLVVNRDVDIVNMSIGGLPGAQRRQQRARRALHASDRRRTACSSSSRPATPAPVLNTIGDPSVASRRGQRRRASISKDTWLANYGSVVSKKNAMFNVLLARPARGRRLQAEHHRARRRRSPPRRPGCPAPRSPRPATRCPPGYAMLNGTSMASPQATGAGALLLSAAKATDRGVSPAALRRALYSSAEPIDGVPTYGAGLRHGRRPGRLAAAAPGRRDPPYVSTRRTPPVCTADLGRTWPTPRPGHRRLQPLRLGRRAATRSARARPTPSRSPAPAARPAPSSTTSRWVGNDGTFKRAEDRRAAAEQGRHDHASPPSRPATARTARSCGSTTRRPTWSTSRCSHRGGGLERREEARPTRTPRGLGRPQRLHVVLRHRAGGRQGPPGEPLRHRHRFADPVHRDQPATASRWRAPPAPSATPTSPTPTSASRRSGTTRTRCPGSGRSRSSRGAPRRR